MSWSSMSLVCGVVLGAIVLVAAIAMQRQTWSYSDWFDRISDSFMTFLVVVLVSGLSYTVILLHDPARVAAFDPCDHSKAHKRPPHCKK